MATTHNVLPKTKPWESQELLEPVVKRYQKKGRRLLFSGGAAFGKAEVS